MSDTEADDAPQEEVRAHAARVPFQRFLRPSFGPPGLLRWRGHVAREPAISRG